VLMVNHALELWMLVAIGFVAAIVGAFHGASFDTSYAMLVPDHLLPRANGMMQTIWSLSGILSPAIAAFIITLPALARQGVVPVASLAALSDGTPPAIGVDAFTLFFASFALLFRHVPSPKRSDAGAGGK